MEGDGEYAIAPRSEGSRRKIREAALPVAREACVFGAAEGRARRTMPRPPARKATARND